MKSSLGATTSYAPSLPQNHYIADVDNSIRHYYMRYFDPSKSSSVCNIPPTIYRELLKEAASIALFSHLSFLKDKELILSYMRGAIARTDVTREAANEISSVLLLGYELKDVTINTTGLSQYLTERWIFDKYLLMKDLATLFTTYTNGLLDGIRLDSKKTCFFGDHEQTFFVPLEEIITCLYGLIYGDDETSLRRKTHLFFSYLAMQGESQEKRLVSGKEACLLFCEEQKLCVATFLLTVAKQFVNQTQNQFSLRKTITFAYGGVLCVLDESHVRDIIVDHYGIKIKKEQDMLLLCLATLAKNERVAYYDNELGANRFMLVGHAQDGYKQLVA